MAESILNTTRVAIAGLGLLGGSLAKRLTQLRCRSVFGIARRTEILQQACDDGILEAGSDNPAEILPVVDLTVLCIPLTATIDFVRENLAHFRPGSVVTDVGSVKGSIVREVRQMLWDQGVYFVGSHPMAGSHNSGLHHAQEDLYQGRIVFLTPTEHDDPDVLTLLRTFWEQVGAQVYELPAGRHDAAVSRSSHVPHLLSSLLVQNVLGDGDIEAQALGCAGGFRDMSRIAAGSPGMWTDIFKHNRTSVLQTLDALSGQLAAARSLIEDENWDRVYEVLDQARSQRETWYNGFAASEEQAGDSPDEQAGE